MRKQDLPTILSNATQDSTTLQEMQKQHLPTIVCNAAQDNTTNTRYAETRPPYDTMQCKKKKRTALYKIRRNETSLRYYAMQKTNKQKTKKKREKNGDSAIPDMQKQDLPMVLCNATKGQCYPGCAETRPPYSTMQCHIGQCYAREEETRHHRLRLLGNNACLSSFKNNFYCRRKHSLETDTCQTDSLLAPSSVPSILSHLTDFYYLSGTHRHRHKRKHRHR